MHCTHSCGSLVKQFPISNEPDLTIYPRKHCRKQDAAAGGPGGCDDIASYFFPRNRVYIHLYLTPCPISSDRPRTLCRACKMLARTPMCHKVWHIWYVCHKCHKCGTKCGTAQAGLKWPRMTSSDLKRSVTPKANMNPTYLPLEVSKNI